MALRLPAQDFLVKVPSVHEQRLKGFVCLTALIPAANKTGSGRWGAGEETILNKMDGENYRHVIMDTVA